MRESVTLLPSESYGGMGIYLVNGIISTVIHPDQNDISGWSKGWGHKERRVGRECWCHVMHFLAEAIVGVRWLHISPQIFMAIQYLQFFKMTTSS